MLKTFKEVIKEAKNEDIRDILLKVKLVKEIDKSGRMKIASMPSKIDIEVGGSKKTPYISISAFGKKGTKASLAKDVAKDVEYSKDILLKMLKDAGIKNTVKRGEVPDDFDDQQDMEFEISFYTIYLKV